MGRKKKYNRRQVNLTIDNDSYETVQLISLFRKKDGKRSTISGIFDEAIADYIDNHKEEIDNIIETAKAMRERYQRYVESQHGGDTTL